MTDRTDGDVSERNVSATRRSDMGKIGGICSGPVLFAVISPSGDAITGFDCALHAANWARKTWPGLEQDPDRTGKGWDVQVVGADR